METCKQLERFRLRRRQIQSHHIRFRGDRRPPAASAVARKFLLRHPRMARRGSEMKTPANKATFYCSSRREQAPSDPMSTQRRNMDPAYGGRLKRLSSAALAKILLATVLGTLIAQAPALWAASDENNSATNRMDGTTQNRRGRFGGPERGVYKSQIAPHWFQQNTRFWYRNDLRDGAKEFIVVDAERGTRQPAFDHQKLAASLSKAAGKEFKPDKLPFSEIAFTNAAKAIQFQAADKTWTCDLNSYECTAANGTAP